MDLALNNAENAIEHYKGKAQNVRVEIVTYGLGLHMLRSDTSPVKDRIAQMARANPNIVFIACADSHARQSKEEGKPVELINQARVMPSGMVRLIELQRLGYAYIRP